MKFFRFCLIYAKKSAILKVLWRADVPKERFLFSDAPVSDGAKSGRYGFFAHAKPAKKENGFQHFATVRSGKMRRRTHEKYL